MKKETLHNQRLCSKALGLFLHLGGYREVISRVGRIHDDGDPPINTDDF